MRVFTGLAAVASLLHCVLAISTAQIQLDLGPSLSNTTTIFDANSTQYANATHRWDTLATPKTRVVIEVGEESDVAKIVCYISFVFFSLPAKI